MYNFFWAILILISPYVQANPAPWQLNLQTPLSPVMERIYSLHSFLLIIITLVVLVVITLITYIIIKFNKTRHPIPSKTSHNAWLEVTWTVIPLIIVGFILAPSVKLLRYEENIPEAEMTLKVVGYQWYWNYTYPDYDNINFDSNIKYDLLPGEPRLLAVDNNVILPINTNIRVQVTAGDVIHSWAIPSLGVKRDGVPGRLNETWFNIMKPGMYYGQCSELCGIGHGFMPIAIKAVPKEEFLNWIKDSKSKSTIEAVINERR